MLISIAWINEEGRTLHIPIQVLRISRKHLPPTGMPTIFIVPDFEYLRDRPGSFRVPNGEMTGHCVCTCEQAALSLKGCGVDVTQDSSASSVIVCALQAPTAEGDRNQRKTQCFCPDTHAEHRSMASMACRNPCRAEDQLVQLVR